MARQSVAQVLHAVHVEYADELKKEIVLAVGNLKDIEVWGEEVLVAPFVHPEISKGGIIMPTSTDQNDVMDDKWQAKCFLVLKLGDRAEEIARKKGRPNVGDWCYGNVQEHWHLSIKGQGSRRAMKPGTSTPMRAWDGWPCRLVLIGDIRGRTKRPHEIM